MGSGVSCAEGGAQFSFSAHIGPPQASRQPGLQFTGPTLSAAGTPAAPSQRGQDGGGWENTGVSFRTSAAAPDRATTCRDGKLMGVVAGDPTSWRAGRAVSRWKWPSGQGSGLPGRLRGRGRPVQSLQ